MLNSVIKKIIGITILSFVFTSCDDPELDALMTDYCECISASRYQTDKHIECIEIMDTIQEKYKDQPRRLLEVIEKTDDCY
ncbi:hypothetical protein [Brumimicrobium aurantiacum]|uniref:Lipoprotein n=1 Tax=Brumimicrobium aurantiacum TaxID=1737063 RepID=A0A3E1EVJ2_9FLAO|nr:hypothetical protein [Brumimicrobium aurantiacum]RFC53586.1 hypothetical protein DXU93_12535 [Brumimicrobium aurantiacum]